MVFLIKISFLIIDILFKLDCLKAEPVCLVNVGTSFTFTLPAYLVGLALLVLATTALFVEVYFSNLYT
jgi:hypothetical protein